MISARWISGGSGGAGAGARPGRGAGRQHHSIRGSLTDRRAERCRQGLPGQDRQYSDVLVRSILRPGKADRGVTRRRYFHVGRHRLDGLSRQSGTDRARHAQESLRQSSGSDRTGQRQRRHHDRAAFRPAGRAARRAAFGRRSGLGTGRKICAHRFDDAWACGTASSITWCRQRMCALRWLMFRAARRRSASSTRPTRMSDKGVRIVGTFPDNTSRSHRLSGGA